MNMEKATIKKIEIGGAIVVAVTAIGVVAYYLLKQNQPVGGATGVTPSQQAAADIGSILLGVPVGAAHGVIPTPAQEAAAAKWAAAYSDAQAAIASYAASGHPTTYPVGYGQLPPPPLKDTAWFLLPKPGSKWGSGGGAGLQPYPSGTTGNTPITSV